jgi:hypothetical protein
MIEGSCHCGAVRFQVDEAPETVLDCNCSICRRRGALWAYYAQRDVIFATHPDTLTYVWGDRALAAHHCQTCLCLTHMTVIGTDDAGRIGVNARLIHDLDPAKVRVIQKNNGNDGVFWTASNQPVLPGHDAVTP